MNKCFKVNLLMIVLLICCLMCCTAIGCDKVPSDFEKGLKDARESKPHEIYPLVSLVADDPNVSFSKDYTKALFVSFGLSLGNEDYFLGDEVWCVSEKELSNWCKQSYDEISVIRVKQLLGLREDVEIKSVTTFWIGIDYIYRPAYQPDPKKQLTSSDFDLSALGQYASRFKQMAQSFFTSDSAFIWTKLGYTYDLATVGNRYGLTQFVVSDNSKIEIENAMDFTDYFEML